MPAKIYHIDLYGSRKSKYEFLEQNTVATINWTELQPDEKYRFFVPKDFGLAEEYEKGIKLSELFIEYSPGIKTERDKIAVHFDLKGINDVVEDFKKLETDKIKTKYNLGTDSRDWTLAKAKADVLNNPNSPYINFLYKPFDYRWTYFTGTSRGFIGTPGRKINAHFITSTNLGLVINRQIVGDLFSHVIITKTPIGHGTQYLGNTGQDYLTPLYLINDKNSLYTKIAPNFNHKLIKQIENSLGLNLDWEANIDTSYLSEKSNQFSPRDLLDYIYAVLHSPTYRKKYKEFLKIDFPRVPFDVTPEQFWQLVEIGGQLRKLHLMEGIDMSQLKVGYPITGSNVVDKVSYLDGKVWINSNQYFDNVPEIAWDFYIGGYQPAQKWLKDRKGRELNFGDIMHYQKIIYVLESTKRLQDKLIIAQ